MKELEGTILGKTRIISLLKEQAKISLREIGSLRQKVSSPQTLEIANLPTTAHPGTLIHTKDSNHNEEPITPTATQTRELSTEIELNTLAHACTAVVGEVGRQHA